MKRAKLRTMSAKRLAEFEAQGIRPTSTFKPKPPKMATAKRPKDTGPATTTRDLVKERSGGICEFPICGKAAEHVHHRRPRRAGGSKAADVNLPSNLVHLCGWHHEFVESHRAKALEWGLLLRADDVPTQVPVWTRHSDQPVYLTTDGGWVDFEDACA